MVSLCTMYMMYWVDYIFIMKGMHGGAGRRWVRWTGMHGAPPRMVMMVLHLLLTLLIIINTSTFVTIIITRP